ncbi:hypothetical protein FHP29_15215 [Nocardioides albidus]|uniref:Uncharacterized protein n=1 Tax=Nocardioides albidus TaxID=1517589 RepID=A0A5C4VS01_9ACTN|nr:hypothetical protein [Nocardioides albidus]TNM38580.1 hypothetical protein FHP29_15215 [Nocardioides albidus]
MATATTSTRSRSTSKKSAKKSAKSTPITDYLSDLIDTTKDVVDDVVDAAGKLERSARTRSKEARDKILPSDKDIKSLRKRTQSLTDQVERITLRGGSSKSTKKDR